MVVELFIICAQLQGKYIQQFVNEFDAELRSAFETVVGLALSEEQWEQASFGVKGSGIGLCRAADVADAAYIASRDACFDECSLIDSNHVWDDGVLREGQGVEVIGEWLGSAVRRVNALIPEQSRFPLGVRPAGGCKQNLLWI